MDDSNVSSENDNENNVDGNNGNTEETRSSLETNTSSGSVVTDYSEIVESPRLVPGIRRRRLYSNRNYRSREDSSPNNSDEDIERSTERSAESSPTFSSSTSIPIETDSESEVEEPEVLKKTKPKHTWHVVSEVVKRQIGCSSKLHSADLFRNQCYGSLHNVQRLELMYKLESHHGCVNSLNFHPDGSLLASGSDDQNIVIWDWKIGQPLFKYHTKHRSNVFQSKFLHIPGDDLHLASCARDGQVRIAHISNDGAVRENRKLGSHKSSCHKFAIFPDQPRIILSAGEDAAVLLHDIRKKKSNHIVTVKSSERPVPLYSIHGHPLCSQEFCVSGQDDKVRVYDQRRAAVPMATYTPFKNTMKNHFKHLHVTSAMYNYNGQEILASYNDADIYLFGKDSAPGEYLHRYSGHRNGATIKGVNFFGPKSEFVVSGSDCGHIFYWEKNTESIVQFMLGDDSGIVNCLEPHPKMPFICTSGLDWDVKVWVPSCEEEPNFATLSQVVRQNKRKRPTLGLAADAPVLWMLWQHLRSSNRDDDLDQHQSWNLRAVLRDLVGSGSDDNEDENDEAVGGNDEEEGAAADDDDGDDESMDITSDCAPS